MMLCLLSLVSVLYLVPYTSGQGRPTEEDLAAASAGVIPAPIFVGGGGGSPGGSGGGGGGGGGVPARNPTCELQKSRSAMSPVGRLDLRNTIDGPTCCILCQAYPNSGCRSWWRDGGRNQPCYLNSNRPGSS